MVLRINRRGTVDALICIIWYVLISQHLYFLSSCRTLQLYEPFQMILYNMSSRRIVRIKNHWFEIIRTNESEQFGSKKYLDVYLTGHKYQALHSYSTLDKLIYREWKNWFMDNKNICATQISFQMQRQT